MPKLYWIEDETEYWQGFKKAASSHEIQLIEIEHPSTLVPKIKRDLKDNKEEVILFVVDLILRQCDEFKNFDGKRFSTSEAGRSEAGIEVIKKMLCSSGSPVKEKPLCILTQRYDVEVVRTEVTKILIKTKRQAPILVFSKHQNSPAELKKWIQDNAPS